MLLRIPQNAVSIDKHFFLERISKLALNNILTMVILTIINIIMTNVLTERRLHRQALLPIVATVSIHTVIIINSITIHYYYYYYYYYI